MTITERPKYETANTNGIELRQSPEILIPDRTNLICSFNDNSNYDTYVTRALNTLRYMQNTYYGFVQPLTRHNLNSNQFDRLMTNSDGIVIPALVANHFNNPSFPFYSTTANSIILTDDRILRSDKIMQSIHSPLAIERDGHLIIISFSDLMVNSDDTEIKAKNEYTVIELATRAFVYSLGLHKYLWVTNKSDYLYKYSCLSSSCILYDHSELLRLNQQNLLCSDCDRKLKNIVSGR